MLPLESRQVIMVYLKVTSGLWFQDITDMDFKIEARAHVPAGRPVEHSLCERSMCAVSILKDLLRRVLYPLILKDNMRKWFARGRISEHACDLHSTFMRT